MTLLSAVLVLVIGFFVREVIGGVFHANKATLKEGMRELGKALVTLSLGCVFAGTFFGFEASASEFVVSVLAVALLFLVGLAMFLRGSKEE